MATKPKKPFFKRWWVWVLAIIVLIGIGNALGNKGGSSSSAGTVGVASGANTSAAAPTTSAAVPKTSVAPKKAKLTLDDGWAMDNKSNQFAVFVNGYVSNNTDKAITNYVQITFDTLDAAGANLGTCLANTNTVDANGKWKFKAICTGDPKEIASVRFKEITGF